MFQPLKPLCTEKSAERAASNKAASTVVLIRTDMQKKHTLESSSSAGPVQTVTTWTSGQRGGIRI